MPLIELTIKHGRPQDEARAQLAKSVEEARTQFAHVVQRVEWGPDPNHVQLTGTGFEVKMEVGPQDVHVTGDAPGLARWLAGPLVAGLKALLERNFPKQLT